MECFTCEAVLREGEDCSYCNGVIEVTFKQSRKREEWEEIYDKISESTRHLRKKNVKSFLDRLLFEIEEKLH